ncbi:DNA polymerase IV [Proteiniclasticum ruminis]|uniref:DNA polymerase IV n=1 Tax=Proteiniclasticum ruminis TaxID=398199 RepID=A0A1I4Y8S1_9CLOT|nr:DNA polymerase IV [Proteiniclasticum ruminis]SFN34405.1 DNA polymerase-4 [Proteiniclasticum ruminis]
MNNIIFLVDMNAFFISCEMIRYEHLKGTPSAVAGDPKKRTGIILAANYEARALGIRTAMSLHEALKICPSLQTVPPDHSYYEQMSGKVMELLQRYTPLVEQNSIDEAWLDMTGSLRHFGSPMEAAAQIMNQIRDELDLWCSIGISSNKFLSKMASEMKKPLGITELYPHDIKTRLWPLPVGSMYGIGEKTAALLHDEQIWTIGDLAQYGKEKLMQKFGKSGYMMHLHANGIDRDPVKVRTRDDLKSIGKSVTLPSNVHVFSDASKVLMRLSDEVSARARVLDKKGHTVQIILKYPNFKSITRQMQIPSTNLSKYIYETGVQLLKQVWNPAQPVRLIGISLMDFDDENIIEQLTLFDTVSESNSGLIELQRDENLQSVLDRLHAKFGENLVIRASVLSKPITDNTSTHNKEP